MSTEHTTRTPTTNLTYESTLGLPIKHTTNSENRHNQTHAATHNICGLCVPKRRCPVVPLSLRLKRESELQAFSCGLTHIPDSQEDTDHETLEMPAPLPRPELLDAFGRSGKRLIVLGLLGTLINYRAFAEMQVLTRHKMNSPTLARSSTTARSPRCRC